MTEPWLDKIHIRDLRLRCIIGINPVERVGEQDVTVHVTLYLDTSLAGRSDDMADTADYRAVKLRIVEMVEASQFQLVERLAAEIASVCLEDEHVRKARVIVEKPGALRFARTVAVEILRQRPGDE